MITEMSADTMQIATRHACVSIVEKLAKQYQLNELGDLQYELDDPSSLVSPPTAMTTKSYILIRFRQKTGWRRLVATYIQKKSACWQPQ